MCSTHSKAQLSFEALKSSVMKEWEHDIVCDSCKAFNGRLGSVTLRLANESACPMINR